MGRGDNLENLQEECPGFERETVSGDVLLSIYFLHTHITVGIFVSIIVKILLRAF